MSLPKILCLHGFGQNASIFYKKSGYLRNYLKNQCEFVYVTAPHQLDDDHEFVVQWKQNFDANSAQEYEPLCYWFNRIEEKYANFDQTMTFINKIFKEQGPFVGIMGFSQGAIFTSILTSLLETNHSLIQPSNHPPLKFSITFSGFYPRDTEIQSYYKLPIQTPSLHVFGEQDPAVLPEYSIDLSQKYHNPILVHHTGGHVLPTKAEYRKSIVNFIQDQLNNIHSNL